jgi:hypothetical protein
MNTKELPFQKRELIIIAHNQNNLPTAPYTTFTDLQGDLKTLSKENQIKLKKSMIKYGIVFPAFIWEDSEVTYIIDAHQRIKTLQLLEKEGYTIPEVPFVSINAKNKKEAAELLLQANSRYGTINEKSSFFEDFDIALDYINSIEIPELNLAFSELEEPKEKESNENQVSNKCPKCGHEW